MNKRGRVVIAFVAVVLIIQLMPIIFVVLESFKPSNADQVGLGGFTLKWYSEALGDPQLTYAWMNSVLLAALSSSLATCLALFLILSATEYPFRMTSLLVSMFLLAAVPSDTHGIGLKILGIHILKMQESSWILLIFAHTSAILPYCTALLLIALLTIPVDTLITAYDLGANKIYALRRVVIPMIRPAIFGSAILGFLLSFNEFGRTYYLSGSIHLISIRIAGRMASGKDPRIEAFGGLNILIGIVAAAVLSVILSLISNARRGGKSTIVRGFNR